MRRLIFAQGFKISLHIRIITLWIRMDKNLAFCNFGFGILIFDEVLFPNKVKL